MKLFILTCVLVACLFSVKSFARDDIQTLPIQALLATSKAKQALLDIPLYFADQSHNTIKTKYGEVITNKKTNAFNKTDREACEWVMLHGPFY